MIEIMNFIFQDFWHFIGTIMLILSIFGGIAMALYELPRR